MIVLLTLGISLSTLFAIIAVDIEEKIDRFFERRKK